MRHQDPASRAPTKAAWSLYCIGLRRQQGVDIVHRGTAWGEMDYVSIFYRYVIVSIMLYEVLDEILPYHTMYTNRN